MRTPKINYVLVGLFVAAMGVGLVVVLGLLAGHRGPSDGYFITFRSVGDIKVGTAVDYQGFPVGQVTLIAPQFSEGGYVFHVEVDIQRGWHIPEDSTARIAATGLLAGRIVDIVPGRSTLYLKPGNEIKSGANADFFAVFNEIAGDVGDLKEHSLKPLIDKVSQFVDRLGGETSQNLGTLFASLQSIARTVDQRAPQIVQNVGEASQKLNTQLLSAHNLSEVQQTLDQLNRASGGATQAIADIREAGAALKQLTQRIDDLARRNTGKVDRSVADLQYVLHTVAANIDQITANLDETSRNMSEFSRQIRANPGLLLSGGRPASDQGGTP
ncbi:MAG TPA: MlaD family protein [Dongiaceae bacterium]|jgi:phospholipid/cholesterol/gamma-HCH transport system substrate-binding protein|nr:MlaD family protein [Dongiaceae bacterium]